MAFPESCEALIDYVSALGPAIAAFIAVGVAFWQGTLQKRQHNLALLEKRLEFWSEVKQTGAIAQSLNHADANKIKTDPEKNHWLLLPKIHELQNKGKVLLDKKVELKLLELERIYTDLHKKTDAMLQVREYAEELLDDNYIHESNELLMEIQKLRRQNEDEWINLAILIFNKIRELKV